MKIRNFTAIALTGALAMSLTACGGETEETTVETTVAETSIEETTEASIIEESIVEELVSEDAEISTTDITSDNGIIVDNNSVHFSYYDNNDINNSTTDAVSFVTNMTTNNLYFRETEFEGTIANEMYCQAGQDVVITFTCDRELYLNGLYDGINETFPLIENGVTLEQNGDVYTVTISSDVLTGNDIYNFYYLALNVDDNTGDYVMYLAFVVDL